MVTNKVKPHEAYVLARIARSQSRANRPFRDGTMCQSVAGETKQQMPLHERTLRRGNRYGTGYGTQTHVF